MYIKVLETYWCVSKTRLYLLSFMIIILHRTNGWS